MSEDVQVLALVKGCERFVFIYNDERRGDALHTLSRFASDPELNFTWYDAAVLSQKIRRQAQRQAIPALNRTPYNVSEKAK
ncbi:MAG: hypothetical protein Q4G68_14365 [Planctomycetia bacterium]|nr:hypothetical protein [Planctomycetia bacterium]